MENLMSALPLHAKAKMSQDFSKYDSAKVRDNPTTLARGSYFKKPKQSKTFFFHSKNSRTKIEYQFDRTDK